MAKTGKKRAQKNSRRKGKVGELEISHILKERGYDAHRGRQYNGADGSPDVVGLPGIHLEVKRVEKLNIVNAMEQSKSDARENEIPVVVHRRNGQEWLLTMRFTDYLDMYERSNG